MSKKNKLKLAPVALPFDDNWIIEIENECFPPYINVTNFKLDFNSNESFIILNSTNEIFIFEGLGRHVDFRYISIGTMTPIGTMENNKLRKVGIYSLIQDCSASLLFYKTIHNNYTREEVGIIGLNSTLNNKDLFLRDIFKKTFPICMGITFKRL